MTVLDISCHSEREKKRTFNRLTKTTQTVLWHNKYGTQVEYYIYEAIKGSVFFLCV